MHFKEAKHLLSSKNGINIYRGCQHGCIYCDSRSKCYHIDHDFEDIEVKKNAILLLNEELSRKRNPIMVSTGAMCDPYMPIEEELQYTQMALKTILKHRCGVTVLTKSSGILRDLALLKKINQQARTVVQMTLTTFDDQLCKILEPNASVTSERIKTLKVFHEAGIETMVWLCPFLPFINDTKENLRGLLEACNEAHVSSIIFFGIGVTLREGDREYFYAKLDEHFPGLKEKYIQTYGDSYIVNSPNDEILSKYFYDFCKKNNIRCKTSDIWNDLKDIKLNKGYHQLSLFD